MKQLLFVLLLTATSSLAEANQYRLLTADDGAEFLVEENEGHALRVNSSICQEWVRALRQAARSGDPSAVDRAMGALGDSAHCYRQQQESQSGYGDGGSYGGSSSTYTGRSSNGHRDGGSSDFLNRNLNPRR